VNADRAACQLPAYVFTDDPVDATKHIRAVHWIELRYAIQDLWTCKNLQSLPMWSVGSAPSSSRQISIRDLTDLQYWLTTFESSPNPVVFKPIIFPSAAQGIISFSYDPTSTGMVDAKWCDDLKALHGPGTPLLVRTTITANQTTNQLGSAGYPEYIRAIKTWAGEGFSIGGVLPYEFDLVNTPVNPNPYCPNGALGKGGDPLLNDYIDDYRFRVQDFVTTLAPAGLTTYWVWNEPNLDGIIASGVNCPPGQTTNPQTGKPYRNDSLSPANFGALLVKGCQAVRAGGNATQTPVTVYAAGLSISPTISASAAAAYLDAMYNYIQDKVTSYPWDGLSVNIEGVQTSSTVRDIVNAITAVQAAHNDTGSLVVGEWGIGNTILVSQSQQDAFRCTYYAISQGFTTRMYFFQHPLSKPDQSGLNYGAIDWNQTPALFYKLGPLTAYGLLTSLYQNSAMVEGTCP
jgi:hypothetical protein